MIAHIYLNWVLWKHNWTNNSLPDEQQLFEWLQLVASKKGLKLHHSQDYSDSSRNFIILLVEIAQSGNKTTKAS